MSRDGKSVYVATSQVLGVDKNDVSSILLLGTKLCKSSWMMLFDNTFFKAFPISCGVVTFFIFNFTSLISVLLFRGIGGRLVLGELLFLYWMSINLANLVRDLGRLG